MPKNIAIDFDGVIYQGKWTHITEVKDPPKDACVRTMRDIAKKYNIIVHTCRALSPEGKVAVEVWLRKHDIPFKEVTALKPDAVYYVDDRALKFTTWPALASRCEA